MKPSRSRNNEAEAQEFADRYSDLPPEEGAILDDFFDRYVSLVIRIHERLLEDAQRYKRFLALTREAKQRTLESHESKRISHTNQNPT